MSEAKDRLKLKVSNFPELPGVYLIKDENNNILYAGKAANLRHRVSSYFTSTAKLNAKTVQLMSNANDLDCYVTNSEEEALVLELNFIKQYRPFYNINLKDDKNFPYIKISIKDEWPKPIITRRLESDGAYYFGPFGSSSSIRNTINAVKRIFPFRSCSKTISTSALRPCLEYDIGRCLGPCAGKISHSDYLKIIDKLVLFLNGHYRPVIKIFEQEMKVASDNQQYEKAAHIRDQLKSIRNIMVYQQLATRLNGDQDVIAIARDDKHAFVQVYFIREGKTVGREGFLLTNTRLEDDSSIITSFVKQFYHATTFIPPKILLQYPVEDKTTIETWLCNKKGGRTKLSSPPKGPKRDLINLVASNAQLNFKADMHKLISPEQRCTTTLKDVQTLLKLPEIPLRIEGYDISNIQGNLAVGSMVVFEKGQPKKSEYRRFKIKTLSTPDDYAMLKEVIQRRFGAVISQQSKDGKFPNLILIDGGKGQLNAVKKTMSRVGVSDIPVISLAKENEEIFMPGSDKPVLLDRRSPALQLLQRIRDEAHRFALAYYHNLSSRQSRSSMLDLIPGIGPSRKRNLIKRFGSLNKIIQADTNELTSVRGITPEIARQIKNLI